MTETAASPATRRYRDGELLRRLNAVRTARGKMPYTHRADAITPSLRRRLVKESQDHLSAARAATPSPVSRSGKATR
jgi:hypothetical protein